MHIRKLDIVHSDGEFDKLEKWAALCADLKEIAVKHNIAIITSQEKDFREKVLNSMTIPVGFYPDESLSKKTVIEMKVQKSRKV